MILDLNTWRGIIYECTILIQFILWWKSDINITTNAYFSVSNKKLNSDTWDLFVTFR